MPGTHWRAGRAMPATTTTATPRTSRRSPTLGLGAYRFSVEWSRIEPEEGEFSRAALDHYRRMLDACHEHGLMPLVTLHHFTSPRWVAADGGWEEPRTAERFARFCERAMRHLGDLVPSRCTINEPNIGALLHTVLGIPDPGDGEPGKPPPRRCRRHPFGSPRFSTRRGLAPSRPSVRRTGSRSTSRACAPRRMSGLTVALAEDGRPGGEETLARLRGLAEDVFLEAAEGRLPRRAVLHAAARRARRPGRARPPEVERTPMGYEF